MGLIFFFFSIEVTNIPNGVILSQRRCVMDLLYKVRMSGCKPSFIPMNPKVYQNDPYSAPFQDTQQHIALVVKLLYLTVTRPDISFSIGGISQFMDRSQQVC